MRFLLLMMLIAFWASSFVEYSTMPHPCHPSKTLVSTKCPDSQKKKATCVQSR